MASEVLIVDDQADIRDVLALALSSEGYTIQVADSLLAALQVLERRLSAVEFMLLDYNLPGMPMDEFLRDAYKFTPKLKIILISAVDSIAEKAERYGIKSYLQKPIEFEQLRKAMSEYPG